MFLFFFSSFCTFVFIPDSLLCVSVFAPTPTPTPLAAKAVSGHWGAIPRRSLALPSLFKRLTNRKAQSIHCSVHPLHRRRDVHVLLDWEISAGTEEKKKKKKTPTVKRVFCRGSRSDAKSWTSLTELIVRLENFICTFVLMHCIVEQIENMFFSRHEGSRGRRWRSWCQCLESGKVLHFSRTDVSTDVLKLIVFLLTEMLFLHQNHKILFFCI